MNPLPPSLRIELLIELLREWPINAWVSLEIESVELVRDIGRAPGFAVLGLSSRKDTGGAPRSGFFRKRDPAFAHTVGGGFPLGAVLGLSTLCSSRNRGTVGAGAGARDSATTATGGEIRVGLILGRPRGVGSLVVVPLAVVATGLGTGRPFVGEASEEARGFALALSPDLLVRKLRRPILVGSGWPSAAGCLESGGRSDKWSSRYLSNVEVRDREMLCRG